jgi:hypothetical protein
MTFQPLTNYAGYEHVLNAAPCCIHPINGNLYGCAVEKQSGIRQNLSIYRVRPGAHVRELVKRYVGGVDSLAQIAQGGCVIHQDGSLEVWASAIPPSAPNVTKTGFQGVWDRIPDVDEPWSLGSAPASGSGGITLFDAPRTVSAWEGRTLSGGELVDIPAVFGVPVAPAYLIRFVAQAAAANVRVRAGTEQAPYFVTVNTTAPNLQVHTQGWVPGPVCYISAINGPAQIWLQVVGIG